MKKMVALAIALGISVSVHAGEGLPLPWPFPWANECPIDWHNLQGRYALSDSLANEQIKLSLHVLTDTGMHLMRVVRLSNEGQEEAIGFAFLSLNQRAVVLQMTPFDKTEATITATIKLYFQSAERSCSEENLVPILTLHDMSTNSQGTSQHRLIRLED